MPSPTRYHVSLGGGLVWVRRTEIASAALTPARVCPALLNLRLERMQRLLGSAAHSAEQGSLALEQYVEILTHEAALQLDHGAGVGQPDQLLRGPQISAQN